MTELVGSIEAGGTKFVCAVGTGPDDVREELRFPTSTPDATIERAIGFFKEHGERIGPIGALGIGSFGPLDLDVRSPTYGYITATPKLAWVNTDFVGPIRRALGVPVGFDTDVNAAALAERRWGAAQGLDTFVYLTFGTGIGGGGMVGGHRMHGLVHPEMGHMKLPRDPVRDPYAGACPYHGDCFEGLASGPAIEKRWGNKGETLGSEHPAWALEADYIAVGLMNLVCAISPERFILGGSVMLQAQLFPMIRTRLKALLAGYALPGATLDDLDRYVVPPALDDRAGVLGGMALALEALARHRESKQTP